MHILMIMATLFVFYECTIENLATRQITISCLRLNYSKIKISLSLVSPFLILQRKMSYVAVMATFIFFITI